VIRQRLPRRIKAQLAQATAQTADLPAPIGGLNTRDTLAAMPPIDAPVLINWIPDVEGLKARNGYVEATTGYAGAPETAITYIDGNNRVLITAAADTLNTDDGSTLTSLGTGFANARWDGVKLGANMVLVNGADAPRNFDGSTLTTPSFSGDLATYGEENIDGIHKHGNRIYMWDTGYGNFFYGGVNSVSGAFTEFQLDRVSNTGGNIVEVKDITFDSGQGVDDYIAFILDTGEVVVYQGTDPSDATNWTLIGKYLIPPIISKNCAMEFAGDVFILTKRDIVRLSEVIKTSSNAGGFVLNPSKLSGGISRDFNSYGNNYGWRITSYPAEGWIIINVPIATNTEYRQYIINTVGSASTEFNGWNASVFGVLDDKLFFGNGTTLWQANSGNSDNGSAIQLTCRQAFSNLGSPRKKKISNARLYMESEGLLDVEVSIGIDFNFPNFQGTQSSATIGAEWDLADWDLAEWAGLQARLVNFVTSGFGVYVSIQTRLQVSGQTVKWYSTTYNFDIAKTY